MPKAKDANSAGDGAARLGRSKTWLAKGVQEMKTQTATASPKRSATRQPSATTRMPRTGLAPSRAGLATLRTWLGVNAVIASVAAVLDGGALPRLDSQRYGRQSSIHTR